MVAISLIFLLLITLPILIPAGIFFMKGGIVTKGILIVITSPAVLLLAAFIVTWIGHSMTT